MVLPLSNHLCLFMYENIWSLINLMKCVIILETKMNFKFYLRFSCFLTLMNSGTSRTPPDVVK